MSTKRSLARNGDSSRRESVNKRKKLPLDVINMLTVTDFMRHLGGVVDNCDMCTAAVYSVRPFTSVSHLYQSYTSFIDLLPITGKEGLLRLQPEVMRGAVSVTCSGQPPPQDAGRPRPLQLTAMESQVLQEYSDMYRDKFSFPFVLCVAGRSSDNGKQEIIQGLREWSRVENSRDQELARGIEEVKKICHQRLHALVQDDKTINGGLYTVKHSLTN